MVIVVVIVKTRRQKRGELWVDLFKIGVRNDDGAKKDPIIIIIISSSNPLLSTNFVINVLHIVIGKWIFLEEVLAGEADVTISTNTSDKSPVIRSHVLGLAWCNHFPIKVTEEVGEDGFDLEEGEIATDTLMLAFPKCDEFPLLLVQNIFTFRTWW